MQHNDKHDQLMAEFRKVHRKLFSSSAEEDEENNDAITLSTENAAKNGTAQIEEGRKEVLVSEQKDNHQMMQQKINQEICGNR